MKVNTKGIRKDLPDFFEHILLLDLTAKQPSPFIVLNKKDDEVEICHSVDTLFKYPKGTEVLNAWPGKFRADVFYFTVGALHKHWEKRAK